MSRAKVSAKDEAARTAPVAVRIAGHEYKIRSDGDADTLRDIAGYVDRAMTQVREGTGTVDTLDVAVLTCLNLAREILTLREERAPADSAVVPNEDLEGLIARIEDALIDPSVVRGSALVSDSASADKTESASAEVSVAARTLELPSVEALHERAPKPAAGAGAEGTDIDQELGAPRVAAGGRDRAS